MKFAIQETLSFFTSFAVGIMIALALITTFSTSEAQAQSTIPTTVEEQTLSLQNNHLFKNQYIEGTFYFAIYLTLVSAGYLAWKKVESIKPQERASQSSNWQPI